MTTEQKIIKTKVRVLDQAKQLGNVHTQVHSTAPPSLSTKLKHLTHYKGIASRIFT